MKIAYLVSRYPALTETFVRAELMQLMALGAEIQVYPLRRSLPASIRLSRLEHDPVLAHVRWMPAVASAAATCTADAQGTAEAMRVYLRRCRSARAARTKAALVFPRVWAIAQHARNWGAHHVHAHFATVPAAAGSIVARQAGASFSFTAHAYDLYQRDVESLREVVEAATFVVTVSRANVAYLQRVLLPHQVDRVQLLHCGVDLNRFRWTARTAQGPFLAVARLMPKKGLDLLVEAIGMLRAEGLSIPCRILGEGPQARALARQVQTHGVADLVKLEGPQPLGVVQRALIACRALVLPCRCADDGDIDGIPVSLMEAMATGRLVISTPVSGISELVEDGVTGLLVAPENPAALARTLAATWRGEIEEAPLLSAARRRVEDQFDVAKNAARLLRRIVAAAHAPEQERAHA